MNDSQLRLDIYKKMYTIRRVEETIQSLYDENDMKTPMHMSMGAEHIAVGICHGLKTEDQIFSTYRSHAHFLAKTGDIEQLFLELYGMKESVLAGRGGSMHLCMPSKGFMGSSAIVGANIPVAVGNAWANKIKKNGKVTVVFLGEGATEEGCFWESLNFACLKQIPIIFVCEDNGLAVHSKKKDRQASSLYNIVDNYDGLNTLDFYNEPTMDAVDIYGNIKNNINYPEGPVFCLFSYYRYLEHVGVNTDFKAGYREDYSEYFDSYDPSKKYNWDYIDPVKRERKQLNFQEKYIKQIENEIDDEIKTVIERIKRKF